MSNLPFKQLEEAIDSYDLLLFDLWGVVIEGGNTYEGVVDIINKISKQKKVLFLSNAPRPNHIIARNLTNWYIEDVSPERVVTSGDVALRFIQENFLDKNLLPKIYHLGEDRNTDLLNNVKYQKSNVENADLLLISAYRDEHEDFDQFNDLLIKAAQNKNLTTICSNPDVTVPNLGSVRYCAGYFASIVEQHGGEVIYTGKPKTDIYNHIFKCNPDIAKSKILMIGDTFETDILGAQSSGIDSALVLTGNSKKIHGNYNNLEEKLEALHNHAKKENVFPSFVTSIVRAE